MSQTGSGPLPCRGWNLGIETLVENSLWKQFISWFKSVGFPNMDPVGGCVGKSLLYFFLHSAYGSALYRVEPNKGVLNLNETKTT